MKGAYRGWGLDTVNVQTLWGCSWEHIDFVEIKNRCISLVSGSAEGVPMNRFSHFVIGNGAVTSTGAAFYMSGCNEVVLEAIDFEGWHHPPAGGGNDPAMFLYADGSHITVKGLHCENLVLDSADVKLVHLGGNATMTVDGFTIGGCATTAACTSTVTLFAGDTCQYVLMNGIHNVDVRLGTHTRDEVIWVDYTDPSTAVELHKSFRHEQAGGTGVGLNHPGTGTNGATTGQMLVGGNRPLAYSSSIATDLSCPSRQFSIVATNGTAFTIANPTNMTVGDKITYDVKNSSGGTIGVVTWGSGGTFLLSSGTFTRPSNGKRAVVRFYYDGTNLVSLGAQSSEV